MTERHYGYCTLCRSRCGSITLIENGRMVGVEARLDHPTGGALCAKGRAAPELVHSPKRLTKPLRRLGRKGDGDPRWVEISWDEALAEIAERLLAFRAESGAESVAFAMTTFSGTPIVDSYDWVERFIRCFGSPNLVYAVEVCGWHKDYAHALTFGRGLGVPQYESADVILLWGHNPARTWLTQASRVADARRRGAKIVVIDPKPDGSGQQADLWLRMRPGGDGALAMGAIRHLIETQSYDDEFVQNWTNAAFLVDSDTGRFVRATDVMESAPDDCFVVLGRDGRPAVCDTRQALHSTDIELDAQTTLRARDGRDIKASTVFRLLATRAREYPISRVAELTWLAEADIAAFYALLEDAPHLAYYTWTGVGQHTNATMTERAIASLFALTGSCDREGGNVWTVPPPMNTINDLSLLPPGQKEKALGLDELPLGPPARGWITARDFSRAVLHGEPYRVRALMSFGTNLAISQIDTNRNLAALRALEFHVHADMFMNPTAECADIVLPVSMPWEREALRIGFEITQEAVETVQFRQRMLPTLGECRADYDIVMALAVRMGMEDQFFGGDIVAGWNHQLAPLGVTVNELRGLANGKRFPQPFGYRKFSETADGTVRGFATPTRRVELYSELLLEHGHDPLPDFVEPDDNPAAAGGLPLVLTTAKSGWFVHTSHRHVASLRRKSPDPMVEISPVLAKARGLSNGDWALVKTRAGHVTLRVRTNTALDDRTAVAEFGWWEECVPLGRESSEVGGPDTSNINAVLSDERRDPISGSVPLRAVTCDIQRHPSANRGRWSGQRRFKVASAVREGADATALSLAPCDELGLPDFLPGQHVIVRLSDRPLARAYSLTGMAQAPDRLSIAVRCDLDRSKAGHEPSLSRDIQRLCVGDEILLEAPSGVFTPPVVSTRPVVLIAGGIGITPFVGYLETVMRAQPRPTHPIYLLHGCRSGAEHHLAARLEEFAREIETLRWITAYSRPSSADKDRRRFNQEGRLDVSVIADVIPARPLAYICGSPGFITSMIDALVELGVPRFDVFSEAFVSRSEVPAQLEPQTVTIAGTGQSFLWEPSTGPLLDAALAAGLTLPSGCRVGQCESCAVRVIEGRFAHLAEFDGEPDCCLTCQAVPLSALTIAV